jgi:hypothetical protein
MIVVRSAVAVTKVPPVSDTPKLDRATPHIVSGIVWPVKLNGTREDTAPGFPRMAHCNDPLCTSLNSAALLRLWGGAAPRGLRIRQFFFLLKLFVRNSAREILSAF